MEQGDAEDAADLAHRVGALRQQALAALAADEVARLEVELAALEGAHAMSSASLADGIARGALSATPLRCHWLTRWRLLHHLRQRLERP